MVTDTAVQSRSVLVVDQNPESRGRLTTLLSEAGYAVSRVGDADSARDLLERRHHDAVVLDLEGAAEVTGVVQALRQTAPATATLVLVDPANLDEAARLAPAGCTSLSAVPRTHAPVD